MVASIWANPFVDRASCVFDLLEDSGSQMKALTQKNSIFHKTHSVGYLCFPKIPNENGKNNIFFLPNLSSKYNKKQFHNAKFF